MIFIINNQRCLRKLINYGRAANERNEVFNKLLNIIGIDTNKKTFYLHEIDENQSKQEEIMSLVRYLALPNNLGGRVLLFYVPDVKKYFR